MLLMTLFGISTVSCAQTTVVIDATEVRSVGGVSELDRAKYFNHWGHHVIEGETNLGDLQSEIWREDGLHTVTGRDTYEYDAMLAAGMAEDPQRPGYFDLDALRARFRDGEYKDFVLNGPRYESLRKHENPILIQSGRAAGEWPEWLRAGTTMPMSQDGKAFAEFLNMYLEEVVYGNKPGQGYLPFDKSRFYIEIMNEPQLELHHGVTWEDVYEFHKNVVIDVKKKYPQAQLGGISNGEAPFPEWSPHRWQPVRELMDEMATWRDEGGNPVEFDFWTIHPYDCYHIRADGQWEHQVRQSPGHNNGILDLFETYSHIKFGDPKKFAITEYGSFIHSSMEDRSYPGYSPQKRQWDKMVAVKEKLMIFLQRPDRIINATPFVPIQHWSDATPTPDGGRNYVMFDRDADGNWHETIIGSMYRMYNCVQGTYIGIDSDNQDLQAAGFRDGSTLHILLNNLKKKDQIVSIDTMIGPAKVAHAILNHLRWGGEAGIYEGDVDVTASWKRLTLPPEGAAVLTLTLDQEPPTVARTDIRSYYGDDVQAPIDQTGSTSKTIHIEAATTNAVSAKIRIAIAERPDVWDEPYNITINGNKLPVQAIGNTAYDDGDIWLFSRTVEVPLEFLKNGQNSVLVDFDSDGGQLVTATLVLTHNADGEHTAP